jgi:hypothetical protein
MTFRTPRGTVELRVVATERDHTLTPTVIARVVSSTDARYPAGQTVTATGHTLAVAR